jgi:uncharacterized SAM-binding protein YcdF (DUF218 family)
MCGIPFASMQGFLFASLLPTQSNRRPRLWVAVAGFLLFGALFAFFNVGRWLSVEDPLAKADAIAVLSGRIPNRALEAARIYKGGCAPEVWLTHSTEPGTTLQKLSVAYAGEDAYNKLILEHEGVPATAIRILDPPIVNTADEMKTIGQALKPGKSHIVILVTSKVHTRRARTLWNRLARQDGQAIVRGASDDAFDPAHWWRTTGDALDVVREMLGMLNAWAGLPLRPAN